MRVARAAAIAALALLAGCHRGPRRKCKPLIVQNVAYAATCMTALKAKN